MSIKVAVRFLIDANNPSSAILGSVANFSLTSTDEQSDYKTDSCRKANSFPWVIMNIMICGFGGYFRFFHYCSLGIC